MAKVQVILTETVAGQGRKGEIVTVSEGYASNYLVKQNKGIIATAEELKKLEAKQAKKEKQDEAKKEKAQEHKKLIESKPISLKVKVGKNGKVFGAITAKEVVAEIEKVFGLKVDKKKVNASFKTTGEHVAEVKLHTEVKAEVKVMITGQ
jgi:large subunit ribosomal protein L9